MKKVLVATCVVAMTAFGVTNASADTAATARANAYGVNVGGSLLGDLVEREPEVTSVLPPGGLVSEDIITVPADPLVVNGTGVVVAETSAESNLVPFMPGTAPEGGTTGGTTDGGLLGVDLLGGDVLGGVLSSGETVPTDALAASAASDEGQFQTQQTVPGVPEGGGGLLGGILEGETLGGLLDQGEGGQTAVEHPDTIVIPVVNARGFARIDDLNIAVDQSIADFGALPQEVVTLLLDALVEVDAVSAEAVAVCAQNAVFFDTASSVVALNDQNVDVIDTLLDTITEPILGIVPDDFLNIERNEVIIGADGVAVNALHVTLLGGEPVPGTGEIVPGTEEIDPTTGEIIPGTGEIVPGTQDLNPTTDAVLDIILGHAEVSGTSCAPAPTTTLVVTGDPTPSLPRTGGLGVLPGVLGVGLLGGAVAAGRLALRSRGNGDSL